MKRGMAWITSALAFGVIALWFAGSARGLEAPGVPASLPVYQDQAAQSTPVPVTAMAQVPPTPTTLIIIPRETTPTLPATPEGLHPLTLEAMRARSYPGSDLLVESILDPGSNYDRYVASYRSEGYKINGLLTIPRGDRPATGWKNSEERLPDGGHVLMLWPVHWSTQMVERRASGMGCGGRSGTTEAQ